MKKAYIQPVISVMTMWHDALICSQSLGHDSTPNANTGKAERVDNTSADSNRRSEWGNLW